MEPPENEKISCVYPNLFSGPGRFVDRSNDLHVAAPEFAGHRRVASRQNAIGEIIHLGCLLIDGRVVQWRTLVCPDPLSLGWGEGLSIEPPQLRPSSPALPQMEKGDIEPISSDNPSPTCSEFPEVCLCH